MSDTVFFVIVILVSFLLLGAPIYVSLLSSTACYFALSPKIPNLIMAQRVIAGIENVPLLAVPFFVCAGVFMNYTGVTRRVMDFCEFIIGRLPGGLAQVNILLSTLMGGLSGSSLADAAMQSKMLVPEMVRKGFSNPFSSVITAVSAMITPLIPPGIAMIIYGSIAGVSIGKLFIAGIGPGLLLCITMMLLAGYISKKRGYASEPSKEIMNAGFFVAFRKAFLPLCLPVIIIGGIRLGMFTPTEAGSIAILYSIGLGLIYREMDIRDILRGLKETAITTASIMIIVGAASAFAWVLTREKLPQALTAGLMSTITNKYVFLMAVNLFLIIVGMFIEGNAALIVLVPLLHPAAAAYGINEIQFAMVVIFNMAIGCVTPPMGTLMFVTCGITKCSFRDFIKECVPFYALLFVCLMLLTFVPLFSQGVVNLFYEN